MLPTSPKDKVRLLAQAKAHLGAGHPEAARKDLERLVLADPGQAEAQFLLSRLAYDAAETEACLKHLDAALSAAPGNATLWFAAAQRYEALGRAEDALAAYDRAAALTPKDLKAKVERARFLQVLGRFDEAETAFRKLLRRNPEDPELYRVFLGAKQLRKGDPLIRQMLQLWKHPRLNDTGRMHLGFALAKGMEEIGETGKVFGFLARANAAQRKAAPYDRTAREAEWQATLAAQDLPDYATSGDPMSLRPVFITGMPRSGTTLTEQIIARHSAVSAGGELGHALKQAVALFGQGQDMTPLADIPAGALSDWAQRYQRLAHRDTGRESGVVTDKSIQSHMILGLIRHGMPGAKIVVVHRDPRDIALSIYKNHFRLGTHRYANDLADIADEIRRFRRSIAHWRARLPQGTLLEMRYEDLVGDPESNARRLVAHAGLDWEDACLTSHKAEGAVQTLSLAQVRKPIHTGRREAWRKFEAELQPFIEAWGDEPWD